MSEPEPEQIGPMRFVQNPDYPYPFNVPLPPHFWMEEQTGVLAEAVHKYLDSDPLRLEELDLLRQYLRQYLERAVLPGDTKRSLLLGRIAKLRSTREIERFAEEIAESGIEPF